MAWTKDKTFYGSYAYAGMYGTFGTADGVGYSSVTGAVYVGILTPDKMTSSAVSNTATIHSITLHVDWWSSDDGHAVYLGVLSSEVSYDYREMYNAAMATAAAWTITSGENTDITVTDSDTINKILKYGMAVKPASAGGEWRASVKMTGTISYSDPYEPAAATLTSYPSQLYLSDNAVLAWDYSQSADLAQYAVDIELYNAGEDRSYALVSKEATTAKTYTVNLRSIAEQLAGEGVWAFRVRAYTQSGSIVSDWTVSPLLVLKNIALELLSPKGGENKLASQAMQFRWKKAAGDASANDPYGFTVQYSTNSGESWTEILTKGSADKESGVWYVVIPADTFPHGIVQWRVLAWTTQYQYGEYVRETFASVVQASTSAVTCDGKPMPTLSWTSSSQAAYQVQFADYDSGAVYGSAVSHRVPYVYADGLYAVRVRTQATTGEWSDWTETQYVQITNAVPSGSVQLSAVKTRHAATLSWTASGTFAGYILYRGDVPVYAGADKAFSDIAANGKNTYFVRAVTADGYYVQSGSVTVDATPATDCLYDYAAARWIPLRFSATPRRRQFSQNKRVTYRYYAGRKYPVVFTEGFAERVGSFSYCFRDRRDAEAIETLSGQTVIYKGTDGSTIYGTLNSVSRVTEIINDISFTVTEIDREEKVPYETA